MTHTGNSEVSETSFSTPSDFDDELIKRLWHAMLFVSVAALVASVLFAPWRMTIGLLIGCLLALLNHRWLQTSTTAAFGVLVHGQKPRIGLSKYLVRYLVIGATIYVAYQLRIAALTGMLLGLSIFVGALFIEAFRQVYLAIIHREESN